MKKVIIVHGWSGKPEHGWYPWLKKELEKKGFKVSVPELPNTDNPKIDAWISTLSDTVGNPNEDTYFVGHSMGCQTIARYIETLPVGVKVGGAIFVAGFFKRLTNLEDSANYGEVESHWINTPINFDNVRSHIDKSVAIFSDDDLYVPLDNQDDFREKLRAEIVIMHAMKHFSGDEGFTELPIVLKKLLEIAK